MVVTYVKVFTTLTVLIIQLIFRRITSCMVCSMQLKYYNHWIYKSSSIHHPAVPPKEEGTVDTITLKDDEIELTDEKKIQTFVVIVILLLCQLHS